MMLKTSPLDILSPILQFSGSHGLGKLWFCGDKTFNARISASVTDFRHNYETTERFPKDMVWPQLIGAFPRLMNLELTISTHPQFNNVYGVDVGMIPPTIRRLNLQFANAFLELLEIRNGPVSDPNTMNESNCCLLPLHTMFPNLEIMHIMHNYDTKPLNPVDFGTKLPATLKTLILDNALQLPLSAINHLPRNLETLQITCEKDSVLQEGEKLEFPSSLTALWMNNVNTSSILDFLPPALQRLHFYYGTTTLTTVSEISRLPRQLVECRLQSGDMSPEMMSAMPRSVTLLSTSQTTMKNLPPNLVRYLVSGWATSDVESNPESNGALPRSLIELPMNWKCAPCTTWGDLPRGLRAWELPNGVVPTAEEAMQLPPSLTKVVASGVQSHWFEAMPSAFLVNLQVRVMFIDSRFWKAVSQMTQLRAFSADSYNHQGLCPLEPHLKTWQAKLTHFKLASHHTLLDLGDWSAQPWTRTLIALHLELRSERTVPTIVTFVQTFPESLRHLHFQWTLDSSLGGVNPDIIQFLPRQLRTLIVHSFGSVSTQVLQALPRTLITCDLFSFIWASFTRDDVFQYLPRTLSKFILPKSTNFQDTPDMTPYLDHWPLLREQASILSAKWTTSERRDYKRGDKVFNIVGFLQWAISGNSASDVFPFYPPYNPSTDPLPSLLPTKIIPGSLASD